MLPSISLQSRRRHRPQVEVLEQRLVPAIVKVQSFGPGTAIQFGTTATIPINGQAVAPGNTVIVAVTTALTNPDQHAITVSDAANDIYTADVDFVDVINNNVKLRTLIFSTNAVNG